MDFQRFKGVPGVRELLILTTGDHKQHHLGALPLELLDQVLVYLVPNKIDYLPLKRWIGHWSGFFRSGRKRHRYRAQVEQELRGIVRAMIDGHNKYVQFRIVLDLAGAGYNNKGWLMCEPGCAMIPRNGYLRDIMTMVLYTNTLRLIGFHLSLRIEDAEELRVLHGGHSIPLPRKSWDGVH